jgi:hypothetical protein
VAEFAALAPGDFSAEEMTHELQAVADAEDRHAEIEDLAVGMRRLIRLHALWSLPGKITPSHFNCAAAMTCANWEPKSRTAMARCMKTE